MIEVHTTFDPDTGRSFVDSVGIVPPIRREHGVHVELVDMHMDIIPETQKMMSRLGFRKVGYSPEYAAFVYAKQGRCALQYKVLEFLHQAQLPVLRWLYFHARLFQPIPQAEILSWRYFTPLYLAIRAHALARTYVLKWFGKIKI